MRIHTDVLKPIDLFEAARIARVEVEWTQHGSHSRARAFEVHLTGESRRRPNRRGASGPDEFAATWDQWGVFLSVLFDRDGEGYTFEPSAPMFCGDAKRPTYRDRTHFHRLTDQRFRPYGGIVTANTPGALAVQGDPEFDGTWGPVYRQETSYWPTDAHGDHRWVFSGEPCLRRCAKCSAVQRWEL